MVARVGHACGRIRKDEQSRERTSVIVAGGQFFNKEYFSSVEILDPESGEWRFGPELLYETARSQLVEYEEDGSVILVSISPKLAATSRKLDYFEIEMYLNVKTVWLFGIVVVKRG